MRPRSNRSVPDSDSSTGGTSPFPGPLSRTGGSAAGLLAFVVAVFVLHQLPAFLGDAGTWVDLVTPFVVLPVVAWALLDARAGRGVLSLALLAAAAYVDGHGIHLAANDIGHAHPSGTQHFWDEEFGHAEWHLGWVGLLAALCWADRDERLRRGPAALTAALLGVVLFTSTVEGGDWWLTVAATPLFVGWAAARRRPVVRTCAGGFLLASGLIAIWAIWQGGVPQFSEVGWL